MNNASKRAEKALEAAGQSLSHNRGVKELSEEYGISPGSIGRARVVLEYGTKEEITEARLKGVSPVAARIRARWAPEIRKERKIINGSNTIDRISKLNQQKELWASFGPSLVSLAKLPCAHDMVEVAAGHRQREAAVNVHLNIALNWLKEFTNAWEIRKSEKNHHNTVNSGRCNTAVGIQHAESAIERSACKTDSPSDT